MRAIGVIEFGGPDQLVPVDVPDPTPGRGDVVVELRAASVNPADVMLRTGAMAALLRDIDPPYIPGIDGAGVIVATGDGVGYDVGEAVCVLAMPAGTGQGTYAERLCLSAKSVARMPSNVDFPEASTLLLNALTASLSLAEVDFSERPRVLVTGAGGAVGTFAVQMAHAAGAEVAAQATAEQWERLRSLGADHRVDRGASDGASLAAAVGDVWADGADVVIDGAGIGAGAQEALREGGRLVALRDVADPLRDDVVFQRVRYVEAAKDPVRLDTLCRMVEAGAIVLPAVAETYPLSDAARAHERLAEGGLDGRLVLVP